MPPRSPRVGAPRELQAPLPTSGPPPRSLSKGGSTRLHGILGHADPRKPRHEFLQELQPLGDDVFTEIAQPRHVPSGTRQLSATPSPTGSTPTMTMGMVWVAFLAASIAGSPPA